MIKHAVLIALVALTSFFFCSKPADDLTFMVGGAPNEIAYWEKITRRFEEKTGITVSLIRTTSQTDQKKQSILIALRSKKSDPDIMLMDVAWIGQMAFSNWLESLDKFDIDVSPFYPRVIDIADRYNDSIIGLPVYIDAGLLYYRTDLLKRYGFDNPPQRWSGLVHMADTIQKEQRTHDPNFWGWLWQGAQYEGLVCNALEVFASAGGGFLDSENRPVLDSEANIKALQFMHNCIHTWRISPPNTYTDMKEEDVRLMFQKGNALFARNWPYAWALHNSDESPVKGNVGIAPLPHFEGEESAATLGGWHICVSKFSDRTEDAVAFVKYITSAPVQKDLAIHLGWNPGRKDLYNDPQLLEHNRALGKLRHVFSNAIARPPVPYYPRISHMLQKHLNAACAGETTPPRALRRAQKEVYAIIDEYEQSR